MSEVLFRDEVFAIIGAAMEVHSKLGTGFLEAVYQEALEYEMRLRSIPYKAQQAIAIKYKDHLLQKSYVCDLLCFDEVLVELKAISKLTSVEEAQLLNYLRATGKAVGLLVNFGSTGKLEWKRYARTQ